MDRPGRMAAVPSDLRLALPQPGAATGMQLMTIKSMTGFARAEGQHGGLAWIWELRSVNGRGLDLRMRLPPGYEALEPIIREAVAKKLTRGSVTVSLNVQRQQGATQIRINEAALDQVLKAADRLHQLTGCERPRAEGLLALKGVLEVIEEPDDADLADSRRELMIVSLEQALKGLSDARGGEGQRLATVIKAQIDEIARLVAVVEVSPARASDAIKRRLKDQIAKLLEAGPGLDEQRLHHEAVLIATRIDVEEELKRLHGHIEAARELLAEPGAVGRKLDFLSQEFNREANTLCSKANDGDITRAGLTLKAVIDQMREQLQNIE